MKSILSVAVTLLIGVHHVAADSPTKALASRAGLVYQGCYSSSGSMTKADTFNFQSSGHCLTKCTPLNKGVQATSDADLCYCGNAMPPASSKVADSKCNTPCNGYDLEMCGGNGFFSVYLTGLSSDVPDSVSSGSPKSSPTNAPKSSTTSSAAPSVVTIGGETVVVTAAPSTSSGTDSASKSGGGPNKAAIAAGVVVGLVAIAAIAGGAFLFLRHRKRRAVEEEYRRNAAVSSFIAGKPPNSSSGASSFNDTRLDPAVMAQRRMSDGSIADNEDYSRRILKVTNA